MPRRRAAVRLIAVDVDGTLLDSRGRIPEANLQALGAAAARGIHVVVATGRSYSFALPAVAPVGDPLLLIVHNGAIARQRSGETLMRRLLPRDHARAVLEATVEWRTAAGASGSGQAVQLTSDTGFFWFFDADNVELVLKVLDACVINQRFWVFLGGLTDVGVEIAVEDTETGETWTHVHAPGTPLQPRLDTGALQCVNL